ncbi:MAG: hypothetical protein HFJ19_03785 [Clostridia bacterium]|nr:hypothetical protein [Clostridia bacterium]
MNNLDMKNIIVLKDLPSNIIDEAIVILKDNKIKKREKSENASEFMNTNVISEAQNVISEYIERLERPKKERQNEKKLLLKYKKLQILSTLVTGGMILSILINFLK